MKIKTKITMAQAAILAKKGIPFKVNSPDGFVSVKRVIDMGEKPLVKLNCEIKSATTHKYETSKGWVLAKDLAVGDSVLTSEGEKVIHSLSFLAARKVYDLTVDHENHRYYANGYSSHNCSDATNAFGLFYFFCSQPDSPYLAQAIPTTVDLKTADTCRSMYRTGAPANYSYYYKTGLDCFRYLNHIQAAINELAGYEVELGSPKQLSTLLFDEFKLPPLPGMERGKSGDYSTKEEILDELFEKYPDFTMLRYIVLNRKLINYIAKSSAKVMSNSFVDDFQPFARVQFSFSQTVIPTGRLSSNSSDGKERVSVKENKTKLSYTYEKGDGTCGFNSQGVTSSSFRKSKARRIKTIPPEAGVDPINVYSEEEIHRLIKATSKL